MGIGEALAAVLVPFSTLLAVWNACPVLGLGMQALALNQFDFTSHFSSLARHRDGSKLTSFLNILI